MIVVRTYRYGRAHAYMSYWGRAVCGLGWFVLCLLLSAHGLDALTWFCASMGPAVVLMGFEMEVSEQREREQHGAQASET